MVIHGAQAAAGAPTTGSSAKVWVNQTTKELYVRNTDGTFSRYGVTGVVNTAVVDATIVDVSTGGDYQFASTGALSVNGLNGGVDGQLITLFLSTDETIKHADATGTPDQTFLLNGAVDFNPGANGGTLTVKVLGAIAYEIGRADFNV